MRRTLAALVLAPILALASCGREEAPPPPPKPMAELTAAQKTMLAETQDGTRNLDEAGLYALLDAAHSSPRDAFGGAAPLQVVETAGPAAGPKVRELAVMKDPAAHRGEAVLVEGRFLGSWEGLPYNPGGVLSRPDPRWGSTVTYWMVRIGRSEHDPQAMVYFPSDGRPLPQPRLGAPVRVAARFYKVFTTETLMRAPQTHGQLVPTGREEPFAVFVGSAVEARPSGLFGGELPPGIRIVLVIVFIAAGFGSLWFIKSFARSMSDKRTFKSPAQRWEERLAREKEEGVEDDDDMELPEDPAEALKKLGGGGSSPKDEA